MKKLLMVLFVLMGLNGVAQNHFQVIAYGNSFYMTPEKRWSKVDFKITNLVTYVTPELVTINDESKTSIKLINIISTDFTDSSASRTWSAVDSNNKRCTFKTSRDFDSKYSLYSLIYDYIMYQWIVNSND